MDRQFIHTLYRANVPYTCYLQYEGYTRTVNVPYTCYLQYEGYTRTVRPTRG
jgi:hypothetical protein